MIAAVITSLDNLFVLKEQSDILRADPLVDKIIVVSNGSTDGTNEWLETQPDLVSVIRDNDGAGPGRNAGLDAAGACDYYLMLDGGIRPLQGGTGRMLEYLESHPEADVIGVEIPDFETDYHKAWRRWPWKIEDNHTYVNTRLSHTAYCLARFRAFDGLRFCEEGPFGQPGWGADDDEMCYQWNEAGISIHVVSCQCNHGHACTGVHPYRRGSGSFRRLYKETGVWPNQHGSVYEQRVVWLQHHWPQYQPGVQWGEPWLTVIVRAGALGSAIQMVKYAHDRLRARRFARPYQHVFNPYSVVLWAKDAQPDVLAWAETVHLRQHHGDTIVVNGGDIVRRNLGNEATWTGDFRIWAGDDPIEAVRPGVWLYVVVETKRDLKRDLDRYDEVYPPQPDRGNPLEVRRMPLWEYRP